MPILSLEIRNLGPFEHIKFQFDKQVNVFVGPNNSGKSTALAALGELLVFPFEFPERLLREEPAKFKIRYEYDGGKPVSNSGQLPISGPSFERWRSFIEKIEYSIFVPALRQSTDFRSKGPRLKESDEDRSFLLSTSDQPRSTEREVAPPIKIIKQEHPKLAARLAASFPLSAYVSLDRHLIQRIIELDYRAYRENNPSIRKIINKVASIASEITEGFPIRFVGIGEDDTGLFPEFETPDGIVPLNVLSQGTQSIIHSLALVLIGFAEYHNFPKNIEERPSILLIDEIDAHLHPSWQRRFLPALIKHFPKMQIFCCTHSPLVLGGLAAGQIQLLRREPGKPITVSKNKQDIRGWSVDEVLRNILDIAIPTDLETEKMLRRLQKLQSRRRLSKDAKAEINQLSKQLNQEMISGPAAVQIKEFEAILEKSKAQSSNKQYDDHTIGRRRKTKPRGTAARKKSVVRK